MELRRGQGDSTFARRRKVVAANLQTLAPQTQAVGAPVKHFEAIGGAVGEDEEMTAQGIGVQDGLHVTRQTIEAEP